MRQVLILPNTDPFPSDPDEALVTSILVGGGHDAISEAALDFSCLRDWEALEVPSASRAALIARQDLAHVVLLTPDPASDGTPGGETLSLSHVDTVRFLPRCLPHLSALHIMNHAGGQDGAGE